MVPGVEVTFDLALAAAFTSMSLRDRCRDPVVDTDLVLTVEALEVVLPVGLLLAESGRLKIKVYICLLPKSALYLHQYKRQQKIMTVKNNLKSSHRGAVVNESD